MKLLKQTGFKCRLFLKSCKDNSSVVLTLIKMNWIGFILVLLPKKARKFEPINGRAKRNRETIYT